VSTDPDPEVTLTLLASEVYWLEGAAQCASEDRISRGLGTDGHLRTLAGKLREAQRGVQPLRPEHDERHGE